MAEEHEEHRVRVVLDGDASSFSSATTKAARGSEELRGSVDKARKTADSLGESLKKAGGPLDAFAKGATKSGASMFELGRQALGVAKAFGGWGLAIAVVGDALLGLVESSNKATEAAERQKRALEEQNRAARDARAAEEVAAFKRREARVAESNAAAAEYFARVKMKDTEEELLAIENALAAHGRGKDTLALQKRETEIRAENLRLVGDTASALELERREELRILSLLSEKEKATKRVAAARRGGGAMTEAEAQRALGFTGFTGNIDAENARRRFAAEQGRVGAMQRDGADTRGANDGQYQMEARLQALELERARTGETIALIDAEEAARRRLLNTQIEAATVGAEREELQHQMQTVAHEAALRRIELEQAAEEKRLARRQQIYALTDQLVTSGARTAEMAAKLAGVSAKKQERLAAGLAGGQAIVIGVLEQVKAVAAFASLNPIQGAAHQAAALFAFAQGGMLLAQAGGAGGGHGGGAGVSVGAGGAPPREQGFRESVGIDSKIPGSPGPQSPSAGAANDGGPRRTTVIHVAEVHTYGTPHREWLRQLDESLADHRQGQRSRRTGTEG